MKKILKIIKKMIGKEIVYTPLIDKFKYNENLECCTGGSLEGKNILIILNDKSQCESITDYYNKICSNVIVATADKINDISDLKKLSQTNIGPFTNVINIIYSLDESQGTCVYDIYHLLQIESEYIIEITKRGIISTAYISDNQIECSSVKTMMRGLATALGKHGVIENCAVFSSEVNEKDILQTISFLNSKYGYVLAGEILMM